jgi:hypothetical protein
MGTQYRCKNQARRELIRQQKTPSLNGIDYLEVLDKEAEALVGSPRQQTLLVRCLADVPSGLTGSRVSIEGGVRITSVKVEWAVPAPKIKTVPKIEENEIQLVRFLSTFREPEQRKILVVRTDSSGDYSTYRLILGREDSEKPQFDPQLSEVEFSFKVECPSDFDCRPAAICAPEQWPEPVIDYLAKDYASFRRLMLDRLAVIMPDWKERNPADLGIALVEMLAYVADHLSYYQDAVATEAYLGTARKRASVRRHARLLDYAMHDGCNARVWVALEVGPEANGKTGDQDRYWTLKAGTKLLTRIQDQKPGLALDDSGINAAVSAGALVFETLHKVELRSDHNEMHFYTWGDEECWLPKGATAATLKGSFPHLEDDPKIGKVLIFEEQRSPTIDQTDNTGPGHCHAVRLTKVTTEDDKKTPLTDPLNNQSVTEIEWAAEDALPFSFYLPVTVVRGNVVLADHGRTIGEKQTLPEIAPDQAYRPELQLGPVTQRDPKLDLQAPARSAFQWEMRDVLPAISLEESNKDRKCTVWQPQRDLLNSDRFAHEFVVEVEDDGRSYLRFGDGILGSQPAERFEAKATYRVGNGSAGNIGAEAIAHVIIDPDQPAMSPDDIIRVRNPQPAQGGVDPESIDQVRLYAPQAFRTQERAVTEADYAAVTERHPEVQKAAATRRWTGSWRTMFVTVDRTGGRPVDAEFRQKLERFLDQFRLAGHDVEIDAPLFVPLDIAMTVCVSSDHFRSNVKQALLEVFSNRDLAGGRRGFFHPDNFTFGQPVYLSQVVAVAMKVPGVEWMNINRFNRWGQLSRGEREDGRITLGRLEIARLDNDPNRPENGKIEFFMEGGM